MSAAWSPSSDLSALRLGGEQALDIYMVWDRLTEQARHKISRRVDEKPDQPKTHWPVMVEFATAIGEAGLDAWCAELQKDSDANLLRKAFAASVGLAAESRFHTAILPREMEDLLLASVAKGLLKRFQLGALCCYREPVDAQPSDAEALQQETHTLGVIDDGCCFAHQDFRAGASGCRIHALWDQSPAAGPDKHWSGPQAIGLQLPFRYGVEMLQSQLNEVLQQHPRLGEAAERALYDAIDRPRWGRPGRSHGARVMHLLAGPRQRHEKKRAKSETEAEDGRPRNAESLPILFVQLPEQTVGDVTGDSLGMHVVDAARYIVERTKAMAGGAPWSTTINISLGSIGGPHDGTSMAEMALAELAKDKRVRLVMAAGNTAGEGERIHAHQRVEPQQSGRFIVRLPPAHWRDTFVELWFDTRELRIHELSIQVRAPGAQVSSQPVPVGQYAMLAEGGRPSQAAMVFAHKVAQGENDTMALLSIAPTANAPGESRRLASPGFWTIDVHNKGNSTTDVHAWIERDDTIIGARRPQQARFERLSSDKKDHSVNDDMTLSNLANASGVQVVGGFVEGSVRVASYSANGPLRSGGQNIQPGYFAPSDRSQWVPGIAVPGFYSGSHATISGTSAAAPQIARALAEGRVLAAVRDTGSGPGNIPKVGIAPGAPRPPKPLDPAPGRGKDSLPAQAQWLADGSVNDRSS